MIRQSYEIKAYLGEVVAVGSFAEGYNPPSLVSPHLEKNKPFILFMVRWEGYFGFFVHTLKFDNCSTTQPMWQLGSSETNSSDISL